MTVQHLRVPRVAGESLGGRPEGLRVHLLYVRHAESTNNSRDAAITGTLSADPSLSPTGRHQALALASFLTGSTAPQIDRIYASPTVRAALTALPSADALQLPVILLHELHEYGRTESVFDGCHPKGLARRFPVPGTLRMPTTSCPVTADETKWEAAARAEAALRLIGLECVSPQHHALVVSHHHFAQFFLAAALGVELMGTWFQLDNVGGISLTFGSGETVVHWANRRLTGDSRPRAETAR